MKKQALLGQTWIVTETQPIINADDAASTQTSYFLIAVWPG